MKQHAPWVKAVALLLMALILLWFINRSVSSTPLAGVFLEIPVLRAFYLVTAVIALQTMLSNIDWTFGERLKKEAGKVKPVDKADVSEAIALASSPPGPQNLDDLLKKLSDLIRDEFEEAVYKVCDDYLHGERNAGWINPRIGMLWDVTEVIKGTKNVGEVIHAVATLDPYDPVETYTTLRDACFLVDTVIHAVEHEASLSYSNEIENVIAQIDLAGYNGKQMAEEMLAQTRQEWITRLWSVRQQLDELMSEVKRKGFQVYITRVDTSHWPAVSASVTVTDVSGRGVFGLNTASFTAIDTGLRVPHLAVTSQSRLRQPINVAIVIDCSGSMEGEPLERAKQAAAYFVDRLETGDRVTLVAFSAGNITASMPLTDNHDLVKDAISTLGASGGTNLYDALNEAITALASAGGRKIVLVLADGDDNMSRVTAGDVINVAREKGASIFGIGLRTRTYYPGTLRDLAEQSGGLALEATGPEELAALYQEVRLMVRAEYRLEYTVPCLLPRKRLLEVTARKGNAAGTAQQTYLAGGGKRVVVDGVR